MSSTDYGIYKLSGEEHNEILLSLIDSLQIVSSRSDNPCILIISGQPGCGKTLLSDVLKRELFLRPNEVAVINGDDYRQVHPMSSEIFKRHGKEYAKFTDPDTRIWTSELLDWASQERRDIVFESTLRSIEPINSTITELKARGYKVCIAMLAVPKEVSRTNIVLRYENGLRTSDGVARWTDYSAHDDAYNNIPDTVDFLEKQNRCIDSLLLFEPNLAGLKQIYPDSGYSCAKDALIAGRSRKLSEIEFAMLEKKQMQILDFMRQRGADEGEILEVKENFKLEM